MPTSVGPNTFGEENLVFGYDTGDTANSYEGPPTQNFAHANVANCSTTSGWDGTSVHTQFGLSRTLGVQKDGRTTFHVTYSPNVDAGDCYHTFNLKDVNGNNVQTNGGEVFYLQFEWKSEGASYLVSGNDDWDLSTFYGNGWKTGTQLSAQDFGSVAIGNGWYRRTVKYTAAVVANQTPLMRFSSGYKITQGGNYQLWVANITMTSNHPPLNWLPGQSIRSVTQGLIDLTGNSTIDLTNVSFDSNAQMTFDGTDDEFTVNYSDAVNTNIFTVECVAKLNTADNTHKTVICRNSDVYGSYTNGWHLGTLRNGLGNNNNDWRMMFYGDSGYADLSDVAGAADGNYHHIAAGCNGTTVFLYVDGVLAGSTAKPAGNLYTSNIDIHIARNRTGNDHWDGNIPLVKFYNRALTASEIKANYNAIKGRFNI